MISSRNLGQTSSLLLLLPRARVEGVGKNPETGASVGPQPVIQSSGKLISHFSYTQHLRDVSDRRKKKKASFPA